MRKFCFVVAAVTWLALRLLLNLCPLVVLNS